MRTRNRRSVAVAALISVALLAACGGSSEDTASDNAGIPGDAANATRTVAVSITDAGYEPATLSAAKGETVTFDVTNNDDALHEFVIGNEQTQDLYAEEMKGMGSDTGTMAMPDTPNIRVIDPGQTKSITWTFPNSETDVIYGSHQVDDYKKYKGTITVK